MGEARRYLSQHFGMGIAYRLTEENPARILAERVAEPGEELPLAQPQQATPAAAPQGVIPQRMYAN